MFSTTSQYALRALTHLARAPQGTPVLGRTLAEQTRVPANYLSKVLLALRNGQFVGTARGSGGGYRLLRPPEQIFLLEIVELFEGPLARPQCVLGGRECSEGTPCTAHRSWAKARDAVQQFLETTTLADISNLQTAKPPHFAETGGPTP